MARQFDNREKMADLFFAISYYRRRRGMSQEQLAEELAARLSVGAVQAEALGRRYYCEPLVQAGTVYIFGGGHVAQELVPALARVGFRCVV